LNFFSFLVSYPRGPGQLAGDFLETHAASASMTRHCDDNSQTDLVPAPLATRAKKPWRAPLVIISALANTEKHTLPFEASEPGFLSSGPS